ncbi:SDR family NAD(P)-dependent oxidoreductase [Tepidanaerobacter syntrophicus]|uniref:3-oxoacyl-[acyl-carrier protein] reductase n=1 Tax=Tepidanaerobacter syntrophicus TaxID=224999 RepID=A0A0U9HI75_9FIRM|nr:3-oxoacyl-ACP reductase family protein [Tepidanaerobacter syntrophicus]GAQ25835.1 3-oxoacyl-[acyl-carrier protein] reductase [Tepidanaerobacter syntrophicus]
MYNMKGKVALVTGAARGIGKACALRLAKEGVDVAVLDICSKIKENPQWVPPKLEDLKEVEGEIKKLGCKSLAITADVRNTNQTFNAVERVVKEFSRLDILVNCAGVGFLNFLDDVDEIADWDTTMDVDLKGTFFMCKAAAPIMRQQKYGKIVNIASIAGVTGSETLFPYSAAKAGVINATQGLARALGPYGINVNAVNPGLVWTPMWQVTDKWLAEHIPPFKDELYVPKKVYDASVMASTALKRPTTTEHIANVVAFLASDEASEITGQNINVDGGIEYH